MSTVEATVSGLYAVTSTGDDDTANVAAAIAAAPAGSTIYFPDAVYTFSTVDADNVAIHVTKNVTLVGRGRGNIYATTANAGTTKFVYDGPAGGTLLEFDPNVAVNAAADMRAGGGLRGLTLDGNLLAAKALSVRSWSQLLISDFWVGNATSKQIDVQRSDGYDNAFYDMSAYLTFDHGTIYCPGSSASLSATSASGQPTITGVSNTGYFTAGDSVVIGYYQPDGTLVSETLEVLSKTSSTLTFTTNLTNTYTYAAALRPDDPVSPTWVVLDENADSDGLSFSNLGWGISMRDLSFRVVNGVGIRYVNGDDFYDYDTKFAIQGQGRARVLESGSSTRPHAVISFGGFGQYQGGIRYEADDSYSPIGGLQLGLGTADIGRPRIYADPGAVWGYIDDQGRSVLEPDIRIATPALVDDFLSGGTTDGTIGQLGWTLIDGTATYLDPEDDHPGILRLTTGSSSGDVAAIALGKVKAASGFDLIVIFRANDFTDTNIYLGFSSQTVFGSRPQDWAGFEKRNTDTYFAARVINNHVQGTASNNFNGTDRILLAEDVWNRVRIRRRSTSAIGCTGGPPMYADAPNFGVEAALTSGLPTADLYPIIYIRTATAAAKSIDIDAVRLFVKPVVR